MVSLSRFCAPAGLAVNCVREGDKHLAGDVRMRTGNLDSCKATIAFAHPRDIRNSEAAIQFRYLQNCSHIAFVQRISNSSHGLRRAILIAIADS